MGIMDNCTICLDNIVGNLSMPLCGHTFHTECFQRWFDINQSCPTCRHKILPILNPSYSDQTINYIPVRHELTYECKIKCDLKNFAIFFTYGGLYFQSAFRVTNHFKVRPPVPQIIIAPPMQCHVFHQDISEYVEGIPINKKHSAKERKSAEYRSKKHLAKERKSAEYKKPAGRYTRNKFKGSFFK